MSSTTHDKEKASDKGTPVGTLSRGKVDATEEDGKPLDKDPGWQNVQLDFGDEAVRFRQHWWQHWCVNFAYRFPNSLPTSP